MEISNENKLNNNISFTSESQLTGALIHHLRATEGSFTYENFTALV